MQLGRFSSRLTFQVTVIVLMAAGIMHANWLHAADTNSSQTPQAKTVSPATSGSDAAPIRKGYAVPPDVQLYRPRGTGQTTGHIADITVRNDGTAPFTFPSMPFYIPSDGKHQPYVASPAGAVTVLPGTTQVVPLKGYCTDIHRPPVPAGEPMVPVDEWIVAGDVIEASSIPPLEGAPPPGRALIPGTDTAIPRGINADLEPELAVPLLLGAIQKIEQATTALQESGALQTPFASNPEREHEAVVQQTFWLFAAELKGEPYTKEDFTERLEAQFEQNSGVPITAATREQQDRLQQGADDFWDAFELVGVEAKVINDGPSAVAGKTSGTATGEARPAGVGMPPAEPAPPPVPCDPKQDTQHTPKTVDVNIADSYGNDEQRKAIRDGIKKAVESSDEAYATSTPPATAYSIWGHDHIGGISSAYAKTVFLEKNDQEWVWSTDPMTTHAKGSGAHTLSFSHGPQCKSVVAGAAMMWIKASSNAFDPLQKNIEVFRAVDAVKEVTVKYLADKLPPGISDAAEAGVAAITDPSSDTYAGATGSATLVVGRKTDSQQANNQVVYKRKGKEDKAIVGGGETIKKLFASDVLPGSLTSRLDAEAILKAGATGNGLAKAYLESLYGTILIGVCECPTGSSYYVLTDNGLFIRTSASAEAVTRAKGEMKRAADRIEAAIKSGAQDTSGEKLKQRAEQELRAWGASIGGDRFKPAKASN